MGTDEAVEEEASNFGNPAAAPTQKAAAVEEEAAPTQEGPYTPEVGHLVIYYNDDKYLTNDQPTIWKVVRTNPFGDFVSKTTDPAAVSTKNPTGEVTKTIMAKNLQRYVTTDGKVPDKSLHQTLIGQ